jgi:hypothetical protein
MQCYRQRGAILSTRIYQYYIIIHWPQNCCNDIASKSNLYLNVNMAKQVK